MKKRIESLNQDSAETIVGQARMSRREEIATLEKAEKLRISSDMYNYLFSSELKAPE
jgi:hypothetical protein